MEPTIIYEKLDGIARIWLNRPEVRNSLSKQLLSEFDNTLDMAAQDPEIRVIIISGKGDHFCGGFDISLPSAEAEESTMESNRQGVKRELDIWVKIWDIPKPFIAAVKGKVIGGGSMLMDLCDVVVAADNTVVDNSEFAFGLNFTLYFPVNAWKLPHNIYRELAYTGYKYTAQEGDKWGIFNRVVPVEELDETALKLAKRMLKLAPNTLMMHKEMLNHAYELQGIKQSIPFTRELFVLSRLSPGTEVNQRFWQILKEEGHKAAENDAIKRLEEE